ncbi:MAG: hypothetical protein ACC662_06900, partial [Planctomycetota bacterium]
MRRVLAGPLLGFLVLAAMTSTGPYRLARAQGRLERTVLALGGNDRAARSQAYRSLLRSREEAALPLLRKHL